MGWERVADVDGQGILTINDVAARLGVKPVTIRVYMHRKQAGIPKPTGRLGRTPWWSADKIEPWIAARKGKS